MMSGNETVTDEHKREKLNEVSEAELQKRVGDMYGPEGYGDNMMRCPGGTKKDCGGCDKLKCPKSRGLGSCAECADFPCGECGIVRCFIEARSTSAEDVTWAVLPYVDGQYGN